MRRTRSRPPRLMPIRMVSLPECLCGPETTRPRVRSAARAGIRGIGPGSAIGRRKDEAALGVVECRGFGRSPFGRGEMSDDLLERALDGDLLSAEEDLGKDSSSRADVRDLVGVDGDLPSPPSSETGLRGFRPIPPPHIRRLAIVSVRQFLYRKCAPAQPRSVDASGFRRSRPPTKAPARTTRTRPGRLPGRRGRWRARACCC